MLKISKQQTLERLGAMPEELKDALISEINAGLVWQIGYSNHLTEDKILVIAVIAGDVIMGFLHPDDVAKQIRESLNLNPEIANSIAHEINRKIFAPIRLELEKNYNPVAELPEIKPVIKPVPEAKAEKETEFKPAAPKPETAPKLIEITELPKAAPMPKTEIQPPKTEPVIAPKPISADQPFIIHQEAETKAFTEKQKTAIPTMSWFKKEQPKAPESQIKVELETFGQKTEEKKEPIISKTEAPKQKIIHYREVEIPTPFGKVQTEPFGRPEEQPLKKIPPQKIEAPVFKPEPPKPLMPLTPATPTAKPEEAVKPTEPAIINLDSFGAGKENKTQNEVKLEGNTINLKKQNPNP